MLDFSLSISSIRHTAFKFIKYFSASAKTYICIARGHTSFGVVDAVRAPSVIFCAALKNLFKDLHIKVLDNSRQHWTCFC